MFAIVHAVGMLVVGLFKSRADPIDTLAGDFEIRRAGDGVAVISALYRIFRRAELGDQCAFVGTLDKRKMFHNGRYAQETLLDVLAWR
jgi:hypothetical protein